MPRSNTRVSTHILKTWAEPFDAIWSGDKTHEVRVSDREFVTGDHLVLREYDPSSKLYGERAIRVLVTYITWPPFVAEGICVMSIRVLERVWCYLTWKDAPACGAV